LAEVKPALENLQSKGLKLAVVTSRDEKLPDLTARLDRLGIAEFFSTVIGRTQEGVDWSDKSPQISIACDSLGILASEAILVGDVPPDIESAKRSGMGLAVGVLSGGIDEARLLEAAPDLILPSASSLPEKL